MSTRTPRPSAPSRVHLLAHANPLSKDCARLGFSDIDEYLAFVRQHLPAPLRLTASRKVLAADEVPERGGRRDDDARVRDINAALADPATAAIIALNGGAWFSRIVPRLDFSRLSRRPAGAPALLVGGFSEMTSIVNLASLSRRARGVYWLCPNYVGWKIKPASAGRQAFAAFWQNLPRMIAGEWHGLDAGGFAFPPPGLAGRLVRGRAAGGVARLVGGCLAVLAALLPGPLGKGLRPRGKWLVIEDVGEAEYRIDRHLVALQLAGWFDQLAGVIVGDFHTNDTPDQTDAVVELLAYHVKRRDLPIVTTRDFGHLWPMRPLPLNTPLQMTVRRRSVTIG